MRKQVEASPVYEVICPECQTLIRIGKDEFEWGKAFRADGAWYNTNCADVECEKCGTELQVIHD